MNINKPSNRYTIEQRLQISETLKKLYREHPEQHPRKGKKLTIEQKERMSVRQKERMSNLEERKRISDSVKKTNIARPELIEQNRQQALERYKNPEFKKKMDSINRSPERNKKLSESVKKAYINNPSLRIVSDERKRKMSETMRKIVRDGKHNFWKGGMKNLSTIIRWCSEYKIWRKNIFIRDNFTCSVCKVRGGKLEAHHLDSFAFLLFKHNIDSLDKAIECKELWDINNGVTICHTCHQKTDNYMKSVSRPIRTEIIIGATNIRR